VGVQIDADDTELSLTQGDFAQIAANAVRVAGARTVVTVTNTIVREWNRAGAGFPAFELVGGAAANPGALFLVESTTTGEGHGAPVTSAGVTASSLLSASF
jgi:hypothetical protein